MPGVGLMDVAGLIEDGDMVRPMLTALFAAASTHEVDIALCTVDRGAFNVAQVLRESCCPCTPLADRTGGLGARRRL